MAISILADTEHHFFTTLTHLPVGVPRRHPRAFVVVPVPDAGERRSTLRHAWQGRDQ